MDKVDKAISKIKNISDDMLMDRLLSDKEIDDITETGDTLEEFATKLLKTQIAKTDKEWIEWFEGICTKHEADNPDGFDQVIQMRMDCFECWEERKKEIGL